MTAITTPTSPVQELVLDAAAARTALRVAGRSHWIDAGRPVAATRIASLATHSGVVDYVPGDLTITLRSGTTLDEIERITRAEGQWLPLDPQGSTDGTIGATIATGSSGPLVHGFGRVRDLVLGVEFVTGDGRIARGGGRVVKNVAGFDLVRLMTGSWGTLCVITEATLRLYSLPQARVTLAMSLPDGATALAQRIESILSAPATPFAAEMVDARLATRLGLARKATVLVEIGGNAAAVAAQRDALAKLGGAHEIPSGIWNRLRTAEDESPATDPRRGTSDSASSIVMRISALPGTIAGVWSAARDAIDAIDGATMHATPGVGVVRCILPGATALSGVQTVAASRPGTTVIYERLPAAMWTVLSPSVASDRLSQGLKRRFDPHNILNPGIMGGLS